MERHAFFARLKPGFQEAYIEAHQNVPPELMALYRRAGIQSMSVFLPEDALFLYLECADFKNAIALLASDPVEREWRERIASMLDGSDFRELNGIFRM